MLEEMHGALVFIVFDRHAELDQRLIQPIYYKYLYKMYVYVSTTIYICIYEYTYVCMCIHTHTHTHWYTDRRQY
jgi:hypothetical protein